MKSSTLQIQIAAIKKELERYTKGDLSNAKDLLKYMKDSSEYIKKKLETK